MVNGVLEIVAAVLFAVVGLAREVNMIWISIAAIYLVCGILNLVVYAVRNYRKQKAAEKLAAEKAGKKAEMEAAQKAAKAAALPSSAEKEDHNG